MPLYEYHCEACDEDFDAFRSLDERRSARCPHCGRQARKLVRPVGIIFKGSGFYTTDYRKPEAKGDEGKPKAAAPSGDEKKGACAEKES